MTITTENLEQFILENSETDLISLFKKEQDRLSEDFSHYLPMFVFYTIKHESDLPQFKELMEYVYNNQPAGEITNMFYQFFTPDDDASLVEYGKIGKYNDKATIGEQMGFTFLTLKDYQYFLDNTNYLVTMLESLPKHQVASLYNGTFYNFIDNFVENINQLIPIIQATNVPAFEDNSAHEVIIKQLASWPFSTKAKNDLYSLLESNIPDCSNIFINNLITFKNRKFEINLGLCDFMEQIGSDNVIKHLDTFYKTAFAQIKGTAFENSRENTQYVSNCINKSFNYQQFTFDMNTINPELPLIHNIIGVKLLDIQLQKNTVEIPDKIVNYLKQEFEKDENDHFTKNHLNNKGKDIGSYLTYLQLQQNLPLNKATSKKNKI